MALNGWKHEKLHNLGFLGRGKSKHRPRNDSSLYGGKYPFVQTGDIKAANLYISEYSQTYNEKGLAQSKLWGKGTLCLTIAANIGETAILNIDACFPDSIVGFIADPKKADTKFIKYYIDTIKKQMSNVSQGATQENMSLEKIGLFDLLIPPAETQCKIAGILSAYDDLIENNNRRIKILEEMAQKLYKEWFVDFKFPNHKNTKFVESELGRIPERWEITILREVTTDIRRGISPKYIEEGGVCVLNQKCIRNNSIDFSLSRRNHAEKKKVSGRTLELGDILVNSTGVGTLGRLAPVRYLDEQTTFDSHLTIVRANHNKINASYLAGYMQEKEAYITSCGEGATGQTELRKQLLEEMPLVVPPKEFLINFESTYRPLSEQIALCEQKNKNLYKTRDLLLPRLISGELWVEDLGVAI